MFVTPPQIKMCCACVNHSKVLAIGYIIEPVFFVSTRNTGTGTRQKWTVQVGTVVAKVGSVLTVIIENGG